MRTHTHTDTHTQTHTDTHTHTKGTGKRNIFKERIHSVKTQPNAHVAAWNKKKTTLKELTIKIFIVFLSFLKSS